jgi:hypothetical protein
MKKSTFKCLSHFLLSIVFIVSAFCASAFTSSHHYLISDNTSDGRAIVDFKRYEDGNLISDNLYLQANIEGVWTNIYHTRHYMDNGNHYTWDDINIYVTDSDRGQVDLDGDGDTDEYVFRIRINFSPSGVYNSAVSFRWVEESTVKHTFTLTFYKPNAPMNLMVSTTACNQIDLSWGAPGNLRTNSVTNTYYIYRDNAYMTNTTNTSYSWTGPTDGTSYNFKVQLRTVYNSVTNEGVFTSDVAGNSKPVPVAPTNATASSDRCDGKIRVQWQWTSETPANYELQRSTNSTTGFTTLSSTLPGDITYYEDTAPLKSTQYYYKVRAKNNCGDWGTYSSAIAGSAPDAPAAPGNLAYSISNNVVQITWTDNTTIETGYSLKRVNLKTGVTNTYTLNVNSTSYNDNDAQMCTPYKYEINAVSSCGNSGTAIISNVTLTPNLSNTFPTGSFKASKGFYPDIIHLEWNNNNRNQINAYYVYRKVYGSSDSIIIATLDGSLAAYDDKYAENGILYEYSIVAEGMCDTVTVKSNCIKDIGFRNPGAVVSGKVTFGSGEPVEGVTITAESDDVVPTASVLMNGSSSYMTIPDKSFPIQNGFSFQAYIRLSEIKNTAIFNKGSQYKLNYSGTAFEFWVGTDSLKFPVTLSTDTFIHVSVVYGGNSSSLYLNGKLKRKKTSVASASNNTSAFILGKEGSSKYMKGYIDEIRIWSKALDEKTIKNDYSRYIPYRHDYLIGYYRLNENINISRFFDISKSGLSFNENHGTMANCSFSPVIPNINQLWFRGLTDENGDYLITGIPYLTDGSSFNIIPMMSPHQFNPSGKTLFMSNYSQVHNNIDFIDISSFMVNGSVVYRNTTRGVKGVQILVDGQPVYGPDLKAEVTNEKGLFEIQVPIGDHFISLVKSGHSFDDGARFPYSDAYPDSVLRYSFNQNLTFGNPFIDTTLITVVGRVIGGTGSNEFPMGFEKSENNIGKATLILDHSSSNAGLTYDNTTAGIGNQIISYDIVTNIDASQNRTFETVQHSMNRSQSSTKIFTSQASGEFVAKLIPERFTVVNIDVDNDQENIVNNFFGTRVIDLSTNPTLKKEFSYDQNGKILDSLEYHIKLNYIYQSRPEISVTNTDDTELFYGEKNIVITNPVTGVHDTVSVPAHFMYPVFMMLKQYSPKISVFESYINYDDGTSTFQSVKEADIQVINNLALDNIQKTYKLTPEMNGVVVDTFKVGIPNITKSVNDKTSFTKNMQINVTVDGNTFAWMPGGDFYRAYIIGQRPKGNNFYTEGPDLPEIILRDPPGSGSSAYIEKGSGYTVSSKYSTDFNNGSGFGLEILLGCEAAAGGGLAGPVIKTDTKNTGKTNLSFSTSASTSGEYVQSFEFSERVETSSDPGVVGSMGDIYIGKSYNYYYGETDHLKIVPYDLSVTNGIIALGSSELKDTKYTLGIVEGYVMNPDNSDTYFKYTQAHILNKLLPELESRRNNLFVNVFRSDGALKYTSLVQSSKDIRYGIAHSYRVETTPTDTIVHAFYKMTKKDSLETYSFRPEKVTIQDLNNIKDNSVYEIDSVRYYNSQIGIWIDAIRLNETEKATAIIQNTPELNISFDGAVGSVSRKELQTIAYNKEESRTKNFNFSGQGSLGFLFNGVGVVATGDIKVEHKLGVTVSEGFTQTMEYGYTLSDGNVGDYYSVNVYRRPKNGIYNAKNLAETKQEMPMGFDFGMLGGVVGGAAATAVFVGALAGYFTTVSTYGAAGGAAVIGTAATMAVAGALSYIPYVSFMNEVKDAGDMFQPGDISVASFDISSPIFSTLGGATMCPYQGMEHTFFFRKENGDSVVLHKATMQREKPQVTAEPAELFNVPSTEPAIFYLKLANNSETGDGQWYALDVDEASNQKGALVLIDGEFSQKLIHVPANTTITKLVTVQGNNPSVMDYDSIGIIMHSTCQFDPTDFMPEIADTAYLSAHFQPSCTNAEILEPKDKWIINVNNNDTMSVRIGNYDLAHQSFQSLRFEYKPSSGSIWVPVKYFVNDPLLVNKDQIPDTVLINNQPSISFNWSMTELKDREYDIRVVSSCRDFSENVSITLTGILDGQRPQVFGTPQPADGILNVDENISIQFNEPIEGSLLNQFNFDLKGTLNNYQLKHEAYLQLNGLTDYGVIPEGISFNDKSFTIECWIKPGDYDDAVILSQGYDSGQSLEIGLKTGQKTYFKIGNKTWDAPLFFTAAVPASAWQHMAYVFDYANKDVFIYHNDHIILEVRGATINFNNSGKIYLGKSPLNSNLYYGNAHDLRIWSKYLTIGDVYRQQYKVLTGNEVGLIGYWPLDEAFGLYGIDKASSRHMEIHAQWQAYPGGIAWNFSTGNYLSFYTGYFAIIPEMDYTIEFWFKSAHPAGTVCLFSNQKGDGSEGPDLLEKTFSIYATPDGKIWVNSKGYSFEAVPNDYFDNSWHHFALVLRRRGNVTSYIDGQVQNERENTILGGIAGGQMALGARKWNNISGSGTDRLFKGILDEFRLWDLAKTKKQIQMDMNSKLYGNETGLKVYFPFEAYHTDNMGIVTQASTRENFVDDVNATDAVSVSGDTFTNDSPNMKDVRPAQSIAYDFVYSEDKIIINPKSYLFPQLEKNTIEITVQEVEDRYGNRMASPETWLAWVHRNQVRWEDEYREFAKEVYVPLEFVASIKNTGGQQVGYSIENLPLWLTATPSSGSINPESTINITFTVNPAINIGEYHEDIILRTENGFDEKLSLTLRVFKTPPTWKIDPSRFDASMNFVGKIKVNGVLSTDLSDMVAVFKLGTDSIRGVAKLRYIKEFDSYLVFLTAYGTTGEALEFQIWDASAGLILDNVLPLNQILTDNAVVGTTLNPVIFESTGNSRQHIVLNKGWNWVSFNKNSPRMTDLTSFFWALEPANKDIIKTQNGYVQFSGTSGRWSSGLSTVSYLLSYQIKINKVDTIVFGGTSLIPENTPLSVSTGWNYIGYIPDLTMDVKEAMRLYSAQESDIVKSQDAFAMYDSRTGWLGTLDVMKPGEGYMLKVNGAARTLKYPNSTLLKSSGISKYVASPPGWNIQPDEYESNLSVVARLDVSKMPDVAVNSQMVIGAFIGGKCHGFTSSLGSVDLGFDPFFLNISNNSTGEVIEFRVYDGMTGKFYTVQEKEPFIQNGVYGTTREPLVLTLQGLATGMGDVNSHSFFRCYPNPFNNRVNIEFICTTREVIVDVISTTGTLVKNIYKGIPKTGVNSLIWDGTNGAGNAAVAGIYYIRLVSENEVETIKITKVR